MLLLLRVNLLQSSRSSFPATAIAGSCAVLWLTFYKANLDAGVLHLVRAPHHQSVTSIDTCPILIDEMTVPHETAEMEIFIFPQ